MFYHVSGWCHVICALFIPEAWFGDTATMEPIILSRIPADRYNKVWPAFRASIHPLLTLLCFNVNDNDDKRLGLTAKADQPDHKKIQYTKNKN